MALRHSILSDLNKLATDALHTAVSEIEGPANAVIQDAKDVYALGSDIVQDVKSAPSEIAHEVKRKFTGDGPDSNGSEDSLALYAIQP